MYFDNYEKSLRHIVMHGQYHSDRTGVGTRRVFGAVFSHDMRNGFPLITTKFVSLRNVATELMWFLRGYSHNDFLQAHGCTIWDEWATAEKCAKFEREEGDLGPVYGYQWRSFGADYPYTENGIDQLAVVVEAIYNNPDSRRLLCSAWNPRDVSQVELPPCHVLWQVQCDRNTRVMNMHVFCRSIDAFLGMPYDIASYALLLTLLCQVTGYTPGMLQLSITDYHLYNNHSHQVDKQLARNPYHFPLVSYDLPVADNWERAMELIIDTDIRSYILSNYQHHAAIKAPVAV